MDFFFKITFRLNKISLFLKPWKLHLKVNCQLQIELGNLIFLMSFIQEIKATLASQSVILKGLEYDECQTVSLKGHICRKSGHSG